MTSELPVRTTKITIEPDVNMLQVRDMADLQRQIFHSTLWQAVGMSNMLGLRGHKLLHVTHQPSERSRLSGGAGIDVFFRSIPVTLYDWEDNRCEAS